MCQVSCPPLRERAMRNELQWVAIIGLVGTICGCGSNSYLGEVPLQGVSKRIVSYTSIPNNANPDYAHPEALVIGLPEIRIDKPNGTEEQPHQLTIPPGLRIAQPFAMQGVLKADRAIVGDAVILVEMVQTRADGVEVVTQSSAKVVSNVNGELRFRIDLPLPRYTGKHHLRIGAVVGENDEYMVPIAEGDVVLTK